MYIPIILGTSREGRKSKFVADFMLAKVKAENIETEIIDTLDFIAIVDDAKKRDSFKNYFAEKIIKADALIIVSPEYNHSYPGELKMMMDLLFDEFDKKPVGMCGVSKGIFGGARMLEMLKLLCVSFNMRPINREVMYFRNINTLFTEDGKITDPIYETQAPKFINYLKNQADEYRSQNPFKA